MKLLSALNHRDMEEYIKYLSGITEMNVSTDKKNLLEAVGLESYDLVLVSKDLPGSEDPWDIIELLSTGEFKVKRIVYIYGEYDCQCDEFVRFLIERGIYDIYVGDQITSVDIDRLIFRPAVRETALGYFQSRYDNERYFASGYGLRRQNPHLFKGGSFLSSIVKVFSNKRIKGRLSFEKPVVSLVSNKATGKTHTAWNMGCCLSGLGYAVSLINIDRGFSANLFFDIDSVYHDLLDFTILNNKHKDILENCWKRKNLSVITGRLGEEKEIDADSFLQLLYAVRTKSDITLIDTRTGLSPLTRLSIKNSTYDLLIFDCDIMHYHMNIKMIEELKEDFAPEKTIAVINNTNVKSKAHKFIYNELISTGIPFKDIAFISSCGLLSSELMHTGLSPYQAAGEKNKYFAGDIEWLLDKLSARSAGSRIGCSIFER